MTISFPDKILTPSFAITILSLSIISIDVASNFNSSELAFEKFRKKLKKIKTYK